MLANILNSTLHESVKVYKNAMIDKSKLSEGVIVGEDAIILSSELENNISINRRNYILRSSIGRFSYTGLNTIIKSSKIGRFCSVSWNVSIGGNNHPSDRVTNSTLTRFHFLKNGSRDNKSKEALKHTYNNMKECLIGNDVLISSNVVILRDVKIGDGAVIGAGAIVTKDVEPYAVVAGVPAKKLKMRFEPFIVEALKKIKWWNWPIDIIEKNLDLIYATKVDKNLILRMQEITKNL